MTAGEEEQRQRAELQRDLGRLEGKVDSLLTAMQNMTQSMIRSDAERDNMARDMGLAEQKATEAMNKLRQEFEKDHGDLKSKLYWLGGLTAAGGMGIGAGAQKIIGAMLGFHG